MNDKRGVLSELRSGNRIVVELGCGSRKRHPESIGVDQIDSETVDIVGDAIEVLRAFPAASVDLVTSWHFLEHVDSVEQLLVEVARVLKEGSHFEATVPHFSHPYFYSDPTHRTPFGLYTFSYLAGDSIFARRVPSYVRSSQLELEVVDLIFKSSRPFYARYAMKKALGWIFNSCRYMQELYEENLCYVFPCYEIRYRLVRRR